MLKLADLATERRLYARMADCANKLNPSDPASTAQDAATVVRSESDGTEILHEARLVADKRGRRFVIGLSCAGDRWEVVRLPISPTA